MHKPDGNPFTLHYVDDRNEVAVSGNERNVRDDLPAGQQRCVESQKQVDLLLGKDRTAVFAEAVESQMAFSYLKPWQVR